MNYHGKYYAKILLFGEYGVIYNSMGLTIPFDNFHGSFGVCNPHNDDDARQSNNHLGAFYEYLLQLKDKGELITDLDLVRFGDDIINGLCFDSSIPQGFGVGSSGALCAAVYDHFGNSKIILDSTNWERDILILKSQFAQMESFFHGISSGLDPLNCYLHRPLHILGKDKIRPAKIADPVDLDVFLVDTGSTGKTGPLVNLFFDKLRNHRFYRKFSSGFMASNDRCIQHYLNGETAHLYKNLAELSAYTLELFDQMIPAGFKGLWQEGMDNGDYLLKLCGSGGGGFLLGFTRNLEQVQKILTERGLEMIHWHRP